MHIKRLDLVTVTGSHESRQFIIIKPIEQLGTSPKTTVTNKIVMALLQRFIALTLISSCFAAKFVTFPMLGRSHYLVHSKLAKELAGRGHEVHQCDLCIVKISIFFLKERTFLGRFTVQNIANDMGDEYCSWNTA